MIRVLLADDQALVRAGFRMILKAEPGIEVVGEAGDGAEAVARARELVPDVVLMDIRMPILDGIEATRQVVRDDTSPRVLAMTRIAETSCSLGASLSRNPLAPALSAP